MIRNWSSSVRAVAALAFLLSATACSETITSASGGTHVEFRPPLQPHRLTAGEVEGLRRALDPHKMFSVSNSNQGSATFSLSDSRCDLGPACGAVDATRQFYNMLAWASTWVRSGQSASALTMNGFGSYVRGWEIPTGFFLGCVTLGTTCSDSEVFSHTCSTEFNRMDVATAHSATVGSTIYYGGAHADAECDDSGNGVGGDQGVGGEECTTEYLIVEIYNEETGQWDYYDTIPVEVCV